MGYLHPTGAIRQAELFGNLPQSYPAHAGWKSRASKPAAVAIEPHAKTLRGRALAEYRFAYPKGLTADQLGNLLGASPFSVRPRVAELRAAGMIEATPERRKNDSGQTATVWRATSKAMEAAQ